MEALLAAAWLNGVVRLKFVFAGDPYWCIVRHGSSHYFGKDSPVIRKAIFCLAVGLQVGFTPAPRTAMSQSPGTEREAASKIQVLPEKQLESSSWRNVGFDNPHATLQTFMWALREQKLDIIKACFDCSDKIDTTPEAQRYRLQQTKTAKSFRALAIRNVDESTADLKFEVPGWSVATLSHRMKKTKDGWKFAFDSEVSEAKW